MEALDAKPALRRVGIWARLSDADKPPRRWWYPPSSRRDHVLQMSEAARQDYRVVIEKAHEKFSETVRLTMLSLLGFTLFCLLTAFSTPDSSFLIGGAKVKVPFADVEIPFQSFLFLSPFLIIVITIYLHIFYDYWLNLETDHQHLSYNAPPIEHLPTLFSLNDPMSQLLSTFIFYWLVPLTLGIITWRAAVPFIGGGHPLALITGLVTLILVFLQIRRCPALQRRQNRVRWIIIVGIITSILIIMFNPEWLQRPLNIAGADLKGKSLVKVNLENAHAIGANLQGADLLEANLAGADLLRANLAGADLRGTDLKGTILAGADLQGANLQGARLLEASLQGANLQGTNLHNAILDGAFLPRANLQGAKLQDANLQGANLQGANLQEASLQRADLRGTDLQEARLQEADLQEARLQEARLYYANLQGANLGGASLQGAKIWRANLQGANLPRANLQGANLQDANLQGANLQGANLQEAGLYGANLQGADLQGARLLGANLEEVKNLTEEQIQSAHTDENTMLPAYLKKPVP